MNKENVYSDKFELKRAPEDMDTNRYRHTGDYIRSEFNDDYLVKDDIDESDLESLDVYEKDLFNKYMDPDHECEVPYNLNNEDARDVLVDKDLLKYDEQLDEDNGSGFYWDALAPVAGYVAGAALAVNAMGGDPGQASEIANSYNPYVVGTIGLLAGTAAGGATKLAYDNTKSKIKEVFGYQN